MIICRN